MIRRRSLFEDFRLSEREHKNLAILELIRRKGPITRTEISRGTDLNIVTVSNYVNSYIQAGLVAERGLDVSTGGRKPTLVELNAKSGFAIGVDVGPTDELARVEMVGVLADLAGHVHHQVKKSRARESMEQVLAHIPALIHDVLAEGHADKVDKKLQGIAVGVPGIVDETAGTVRDMSRGGIRSSYTALRDELEQKYKVPVLIGNDATLAALGELRLGLTKEVRHLLYLSSDVSCGIILNGNVYWGAAGSAGELGINRPTEDDVIAWEKSAAYLRPTGSDLGIPAQVRKLIGDGIDSKVSQLSRGKLESLTLETVIQAARQDDQLAMEVIESAAINLGIRIAYLVNLLNPEVVVLGGGIEQAGSTLLEPVFRTVRRWAFEEAASQVDIVPAQLGEDGVALGAASWVAREVFLQV
ncbi:MAG: ROK family transcriptional regulator [Candidatus Omnitrophica bacterium]|nr:ROK family transcriptional regulator [Candidatus Omnitrophota bacterium]